MSKDRKRIALVIDFIATEYSQFIIKGIKRACADYNYEFVCFVIGTIKDVSKPYAYQNLAISAFISKNNVDGIVFVSGTQMHNLTKTELNSYLKSYKSVPIVNISDVLSGIPSITVECDQAYKIIINEIVNNQNCKRFGILGSDSNSTEIKQRQKSIKNVLNSFGVSDSNITVWKTDLNYYFSKTLLENYWTKHGDFCFDAVFAINDEMAAACLDFCKEHGIKVPEDVVVAGFDDSFRALYSSPSLTSVNQEISEQGYEACRLLGRLIDGQEVPDNTLIQASPVFRLSTQHNKYSKDLKKVKELKIDTEKKLNKFYENAVSNWYTEKDHFYQMTDFLTNIQADVTLEQFQERINEDLKRLGVTACAIVVFNTPIEKNSPFDYFNLPHKAFVLSAFDYGTGVDTAGSKTSSNFDPNEMLIPDGLLKFGADGLYMFSLYHNTLQYGYLIIRPGNFDIYIYDLLCKMLSSIVANVYSNHLVAAARDQIEKKYNQLDFVASTDALTGIYNRRGLFDEGNALIKYSKKTGQEGLIIYSDMDGLKKINDTFGHETGDRAIIAESVILKRNFRSCDIVSRIGGDEFAMICPGLTADAFEKIRAKIDRDCENWIDTCKTDYKLSISMGFVKYPGTVSGYNLVRLLSEADEKLYLEKNKKHTLQN